MGAVETFLKQEPAKRLAFLLADRCKIDQPEQAKAALLAEKLSGLVRSLALLSLLIDLLTNRNTAFHKQILDALDEEGTKGELPGKIQCRLSSEAIAGFDQAHRGDA